MTAAIDIDQMTGVLVDTAWVEAHVEDPMIRIVESDEDIILYERGHIKNALKIDWHTEEQDAVRRDFVDKAGFERLMERKGISPETTVVFYGDKNNWYATYTFWLFKLYGHANCKIMDGGRTKWEAESRAYTADMPLVVQSHYQAKEADASIRIFRDEVLAHYVNGGSATALVDVRSPQEFSGEVIAMVNYAQEGAQRGGHIPGARSIPWGTAVNADGTFKSMAELNALYGDAGITTDKDIVAYCRIGERSSHTWFVLTQLLGYKNVRNYDGSWTEWGSLVGVPIER